MSGLMMVYSDAPKGREAEFNAWYDRHARARLDVVGIESAQRYIAVGSEPRYMANYELASLEVLDSPQYRQLRTNRPAGEQAMLDSLPTPIDRRVYRSLSESVNDGYSVEASTHVLAVAMTVDDPDDYHRWYDEEHISLLFDVPGWLRCRRYELVSGNGPQFLALHDLASRYTVNSPAALPARSTPWRGKIALARTAYERRLYELVTRFDPHLS